VYDAICRVKVEASFSGALVLASVESVLFLKQSTAMNAWLHFDAVTTVDVLYSRYAARNERSSDV
jgi:hypothetical protein